jgi:hypothetical protein
MRNSIETPEIISFGDEKINASLALRLLIK